MVANSGPRRRGGISGARRRQIVATQIAERTAKELASGDKETVRAAARALGVIAGSGSVKALAAARATAAKETRAAIDDAYLVCADQFLKQGKKNEAVAIYQELTKEPAGKATRLAALRGTLRDHVTRKRRPFVRFFACEEDLSHEPPDTPLPAAVTSGAEPFLIIGAIAGG